MFNKSKHFAVVLGTRPNFIKAAPFFKEARKHPEYNFTIIHTGQHFDYNMSKIFFEEMFIPNPDVFLDSLGELHSEKIGRMFSALTAFFSNSKFDGVIVFGDVKSTLAGALAAAKNGLRVIHIESGLRSNDRRMPEEINRTIVDHLSDLLFITEPSAYQNLIREGIAETKIKYVGNLMIESIEIFLDKIMESNILEILKLKSKAYIVVTIHRQENVDNKQIFEKILLLLKELNKTARVILPLHPGTKKEIVKNNLGELLDEINVIAPLGYFEFMKLVIESKGIVTDSGGIQEEASHLGIPCCTLRDNTERVITIELGSNKLFPIELSSVSAIEAHLNRNDFKSKHMPLWDNKVSQRIFNFL